MAKKRKSLTLKERKTLARKMASNEITVAIVEAFNTLADNGVDQVALLRLITTRKKSEDGRPAKTERIVRLALAISEYQSQHPEASKDSALVAVIEQSPSYEKLDPKSAALTVESERMAYWREKRKLIIQLIRVLRAIVAKAESAFAAKTKALQNPPQNTIVQ